MMVVAEQMAVPQLEGDAETPFYLERVCLAPPRGCSNASRPPEVGIVMRLGLRLLNGDSETRAALGIIAPSMHVGPHRGERR